MTRTLGYFLAGSVAGIALLAGAFALRDWPYGPLCVAVAGAICIIPTLLSLALTLWSKNRSGSEQLLAIMGGMVLRMGSGLALGLLVFLSVPQFRENRERELLYWSAILICYVGTLAWETFLTARERKSSTASPAAAAGGAGE